MDNGTEREMYCDGWCKLASRVVRLAADDYRFALRQIKRDRRNRNARKEARRLEHFFLHGWYRALLKIDAEALIYRLREEIRNEC